MSCNLRATLWLLFTANQAAILAMEQSELRHRKVIKQDERTSSCKEISDKDLIEEFWQEGKKLIGKHNTPQDYKNGFFYLEKAANQNHAKAQHNLGVLYEFGLGIPQSPESLPEKALEWYTKSALNGFDESKQSIDRILPKLKLEKVTKEYLNEIFGQQATQAAALYYTIAQSQLYYKAARSIGKQRFYKSYLKLFNSLTLAAHLDCQKYEAHHNLGVLYEDGLGTDQSIEKAIEWYTIAAEHGNEDAKKALDRLAKQ